MTIVVDANIVVNLATPGAAASSRSWLLRWQREGEDLHSPMLFTYEVASALVRMIATRRATPADSDALWDVVGLLNLTLHPPVDGAALVDIAVRLQRRSAYDAAYVELAVRLGCDLWTLDGPLARNASSLGLPVRLLV